MTIYDMIKSDLKIAMKKRDKKIVSFLRILVGDIQRQKDKDYTDNSVISIIKKSIKDLEDFPDVEYEKILKKYLPSQITEDEIKKYILSISNIDKYNIGQLIGTVMKHFPNGSINGNMVRKIVTEIIN